MSIEALKDALSTVTFCDVQWNKAPLDENRDVYETIHQGIPKSLDCVDVHDANTLIGSLLSDIQAKQASAIQPNNVIVRANMYSLFDRRVPKKFQVHDLYSKCGLLFQVFELDDWRSGLYKPNVHVHAWIYFQTRVKA